MEKSYKTFILIFIVAVAAAWAGSILIRNAEEPEVSQDAAEFAEKIQSFVVENFGQPIDSGFTAPMYLRAFPGLLESDFDGVETSEGKYEYSDGKLSFIKTPIGRYSTFDEAILEKGHETLLSNIRGRFGNNLSVDEIIKGITAQGIGRVSGTILLGPGTQAHLVNVRAGETSEYTITFDTGIR